SPSSTARVRYSAGTAHRESRKLHHANPISQGLGDDQALAAQRQRDRVAEERLAARAVPERARAVAGERDHRAIRSDLTYALVGSIGHIDVAGGVDRDARGAGELRDVGRAVLEARRPGAGEGDDLAVGEDLAHAVVQHVADVDVAGGVCGRAGRVGGHVVHAVAGDGRRGAVGGRHAPDAQVEQVDHDEVAVAVERHAERAPEGRGPRRAARAVVEGGAAVAGQGRDRAAGGNGADAVLVVVRDVDRARGVDGDAVRVVEGGGLPVAGDGPGGAVGADPAAAAVVLVPPQD